MTIRAIAGEDTEVLIAHAQTLIARKLDQLNRRHMLTGGNQALQLEDWTWRERALDLQHRVAQVWLEAENGQRPSLDHVLSVTAAGLAFVMALYEAEVADPASGGEVA